MKTHTRLLLALAMTFASGIFLPSNARAQAGDDIIYAWYRADKGLKLNGSRVIGWENDASRQRHLTSIRGTPKAVRVDTPSGASTIVRFDGESSIWRAAKPWGTLSGDRTIIAYARLADNSAGFLFDGATGAGLSRAQVRRGKWQAGAQPTPAKTNADKVDRATLAAVTGVWQAHAFVFTRDKFGNLSVRHMISDAGGLRSKTVATFADAPQGGLIVGSNCPGKFGLKGDLAEMLVMTRAMSEQEFAKIAAVLRARWGEPTDSAQQIAERALPEASGLFRTVVRKQGDDGVHTYRIPGLATTPKGTLIAVFDARNTAARDVPADIDIGMMRSTDNGATWSPMQRILDFPADAPGSAGNGVTDPSVLVDEKTGSLFVAALWSHGERGWAGSGPGLSPQETGQLVLTKSTDDGVTWSEPINITRQVKNPVWRICFQGPGRGIQLRDGTLVFPAQFREASGPAHSCFIWSADGGETWQISAPAIPGKATTSESQIAQLPDGALLLSMRGENTEGKRLWARYDWSDSLGNGKWSAPWFTVPDPRCQASLIAHPSGSLLFSNPNSPTLRVAMTVRTSIDGGKTWNAGQLIDPRPSSYSCMAVLKDGSVGILYETGETYPAEMLAFARFPLEWIMAASSAEALTLAHPFSDHMVLQQGGPAPVWGTCAPKAAVTVEFAGHNVKTTADDSGRWRADMPALEASAEPRTLRVISGPETLEIKDVLVGEVWICAGQSNMEWPLSKEARADEELPRAANSQVRLMGLDFASKYVFAKSFSDKILERMTPEKFYSGTWTRCEPGSAASFSAIGYYFARDLQAALGVPVGVINLAVGGSPAEAWVSRETLSADSRLGPMAAGNWLENEALDPWCRQRGMENIGVALKAGTFAPNVEGGGPDHPFKPGFLWDSGIAPLLPLAMRGVLWHQGESNALSAWRVAQHEQLFPLLVRDWRARWGRGDFSFFFCQLSSIEAGPYKSENWPQFRDSQRRMADEIPNAGMAVTSDVGARRDVHPRDKHTVGARLTRLALAQVYGQNILRGGPVPASMTTESDVLRVTFAQAGSRLRTSDGSAPRAFEVAGADGKFHPAEAKLDRDSVLLSASAVPSPSQVRYAWTPYSEGNLINDESLPASTFKLPAETGN
ncbi:exo-alpha-sialidase [Ereboglobus luteus]|uniref:Sialidase domain-containing protein n=1 Tax=Ereboglobus luteus TaxID=1796921 RepID=A0A2U8E435_9BACT|nr:exo-alpha-sialidase [Ereboglobus luteus]AWI09525.1 hypothetical protein CKA38_09970 [Ereboglobus luteus]